jgi:hypothetical protein
MAKPIIEQRLAGARRFKIPDHIIRFMYALYPPIPGDVERSRKHHNLRIGLAVEFTIKEILMWNNIEFKNLGGVKKIDFEYSSSMLIPYIAYDVKAMGYHNEVDRWVLSQNISANVSAVKEWAARQDSGQSVYLLTTAYTSAAHDEFVILGCIDWRLASGYARKEKATIRNTEDRVKLYVEAALQHNSVLDPLLTLLEHSLELPV